MSFSAVRGWRIKVAGMAVVLVVVTVGVLRTVPRAVSAENQEAPKGGPPADVTPARLAADDLDRRIADGYPSLEDLYKHLHQYPELPSQEEQTASRLAHAFPGPASGFVMTREVGGHGLVAVVHNGPGPTVLVRTEMDALPIEEQTGLPYASKVRARDRRGNEVGVMHACGHDVHMTCWVGTARILAQLKDRWHGTLVFIAQPAEETGSGAESMLEDGLFRKFPRPDYCLALHCDANLEAGHVSYTRGLAMANVDSVDITMRGRGGHGATPQLTVDPIVLSARLVLDLQTLVSRENNPTDPLVVTVGSIHGGTKNNVIPDEVKLQLTVRSTSDASRKHALEGIRRMARAVAAGADAPEPRVNIHPGAFTPALVNDGILTDRTVAVFRAALGEGRVHQGPPRMLGEDFAVYGRQGVPIFLYFLGTQSPERIAEAAREDGRPLPSLHSDLFYPTPEPTIKTGVRTMTLAVLNLLGKGRPSPVAQVPGAGARASGPSPNPANRGGRLTDN
jgi:hippurate hydrolase